MPDFSPKFHINPQNIYGIFGAGLKISPIYGKWKNRTASFPSSSTAADIRWDRQLPVGAETPRNENTMRCWTVCHRETIFWIQIFFSDQMMFWSFEFFGRDWLLLSILILKSMKSMVFVVRCRESIVLIQIFFCDQIMFWSFEFFGL